MINPPIADANNIKRGVEIPDRPLFSDLVVSKHDTLSDSAEFNFSTSFDNVDGEL